MIITHYITHYTLHTTLHITHYTLHITYYTLHTTHYTLHTTLHITHYITRYTLHTTHYTLHITHYTLHITHYTRHITQPTTQKNKLRYRGVEGEWDLFGAVDSGYVQGDAHQIGIRMRSIDRHVRVLKISQQKWFLRLYDQIRYPCESEAGWGIFGEHTRSPVDLREERL